MYPFDSAPPCIYGTLKMRTFSSSDSFPKLIPIVSRVGSFNYNVARFFFFFFFFCDLLSPLVPSDYSCRDTFSFVSEIKNANLSRKFLVHYDITSNFTNIAASQTHFIFDSKFYNQNDAVAIGLSFGSCPC